MDLCNNEAWLRESAHAEDSEQAEAGLAMKEYSESVQALTVEQMQQLRQQVKVQSILFVALRDWMESWDLGAGLEATYTIARRLVRTRLADLNPQQQGAIEELLSRETIPGSISKVTRQQTIAILSGIFTQEDWQAMAEAASHSISSRVLNAGQIQTGAAV